MGVAETASRPSHSCEVVAGNWIGDAVRSGWNTPLANGSITDVGADEGCITKPVVSEAGDAQVSGDE